MDRNVADRCRLALLQPQWADALSLVARAAVDSGLGDGAGVAARLGDGTLRTIAATDPLVDELQELQYRSGQGPCVESATQACTMQSREAGVDPRWAVWGPEAARRGIGGVLSVPLATAGRSLGALTLYHRGARDHSVEDQATAASIGDYASIAVAHLEDTEQLWKAIDARHRIGQAQGILMERFNITAEAAFSLLRRLSQENHVKLHLIAEQVVRTRTLPPTFGGGAPAQPAVHHRRSSDVVLPRAH